MVYYSTEKLQRAGRNPYKLNKKIHSNSKEYSMNIMTYKVYAAKIEYSD